MMEAAVQIQIAMIQRYERRTIEEELVIAREELAPDYQQLHQIPFQQLTSSDSAQLVLSMITRLSSPIIGVSVLRHDLFQMEFPYLAQYEMIMEKAEHFYYQSIMQDLNRIKNDEPVMQVNPEEIRQCVEELNWKINVERSSILNDSQEIGENMDLMKFFEGVRNYQNWQESIRKECFERLKERSHAVEKELTFKKGFIISKLDHIFKEVRTKNLAGIFKIAQKHKKRNRFAKIADKLVANKYKDYFGCIKERSQQPNAKAILLNMFIRTIPKRLISEARKVAIQVKSRTDKINKLIFRTTELKRNRQLMLKYSAFRQLNLRPMIKASKITEAVKLTTLAYKKIALRLFLKALHLPVKLLVSKLSQLERDKLQIGFKNLKENNLQIKLNRANVSYRIKGKILASLNKYEKEPINTKKTFQRWYLNTHQNKFSKKIYNIWLNGNISKFTVFMRMKNMIDLINKQMISKEMKNFIKILCERYGKYEEYNRKHMLTKWIENTRRIRKIEGMFTLLTNITNETQQIYKKTGHDKFINYCRRIQVIQGYCQKYLHQYTENRKIALQKWRNINNIKKEWGKAKLRAIFLNIVEEIRLTEKEVLEVFKANRIEGREKKMQQCRKAFNKDLIFMQRFYQTWRYNVITNKKETFAANTNATQTKTASLVDISAAITRVNNMNLREIIKKFKQNKAIRMKRRNSLKNGFMRMIENNEKLNKKDVIDVFIHYWREGKAKKENLVRSLVHANVVKEKVGFCIWKNKATEILELAKREKSTRVFEILSEKIKNNYQIFNKKLFVIKVLQKIVTNRTENIRIALHNWKSMPLRMRWQLRTKSIALFDQLTYLMNKRLLHCQSSFKTSIVASQLKKKKGVYVMACKFEMMLRKYFLRYRKNAGVKKQNDQIKSVSKIFERMNARAMENLKPVFLAPPEWPKKAQRFVMLNEKLKKRVTEYFRVWQKNSSALKYFNKIADEKKKRCLQILNKVLLSNETQETKKIIERFHHNSRINQLQINFLKRLCDSQAGKVIKGFMIWKNMPVPKNKERIGRATKFESNLSRMVIKNIKITMNVMKDLHYIGNQKKKYCIRKLVAISCSGIGQYFDKWRENKRLINLFNKNRKVEKIFESINAEQQKYYKPLVSGDEAKKKRRSLQIVDNWWTNQKKYYIKRWFKNVTNMKLMDVSKKHLLRNLNSISNRVSKKKLFEQVILKFGEKKMAELKEKKRMKTEQILKIIDNYEAHKRTLLNETVDKLKFNHLSGNFKKSKAFHKFLMEKIGQVHKNLAIWNNLAQAAKETHKQRIATHNFDLLYETLRANFKTIFARTREQTIKKNTLDKIFKVQEIKFKGFFDLWRQRVKELKILGELDKKTKTVVLEKITKILNATSTQTVIQTIRKFQMNSKIQKVQRKFIERLLQTKSGKAIHAFKAWKSIPMNKMMGKYKNYQKFYFKLEAFYKERMKFAHSIFNSCSQDGNLMKKQSILKLFEMTSLGIRRFYNRWTRLTKEKHILLSVNSTFRAFQTSSIAIANQYQIIFQDDRAYRIKISAIEKLIRASQGTTQNYLIKWRDNVREMNMLNSMDKQKKKMALQMFTRVIGNSSTGQVINIISLFQKNAKMVQISRAFFNRLMNTKTGKVLKFFEKLKTVPDAKLNKRKKKGIIFESRLNLFVMKRLRDSITPFKENVYAAVTKKKYCLDRLLRACMGENQKKFLVWRNVVREGKILSHTSLFDKIFNNAENVYRDNFSRAIRDAPSEIQKKKALCRKLLNNSLFVQHHAYMIWKEAYHLDGINISKKQNITQNHLNNLINIFKSNENKKVVQAIGVFRRILQLRHFQEFNYYKDYKNQKCLTFFDNLNKINQSSKSLFISALKTNSAEYILAEKSKKLLSVFQSMQAATKTNMSYLIRTETQTALLNKTFTRLINNTNTNLGRVFNMWRENKNTIDHKRSMKKENKKSVLILLNNIYSVDNNKKISEAISKFVQNRQVNKIKKEVLLKMLKAKTNKVPTSFNTWKKLPYQEAKKLKNKATKFENGLIRLMMNRLREVNDCFKRERVEGITKRENAARTIVRSKLIDSNRLFFKWRKTNNQIKVTEKIIYLDRALGAAQSSFQQHFSIFDGCKMQDQRKIQAVTNLFNNNVQRLRAYYTIWRKSTRSNKLHLFQKYMRNFNPEDFNKRLIRIGFIMIEKKKDMEALKGYINSLWKWKMSNIQATYYTKFIKVFKESEELIKLSNLLNKKLYENSHHCFRSILFVGHERTNRKREIVQKYLTRKARNYFLAFKNGTSKTQINIWKSKYTESIKGKIWADILSSIFLKTQFAAFSLMKDYNTYTHKIDSLASAARNYQKDTLLRKAFNKIKYDGQNKIFTLLGALTDRSEKGYLNDSFQLLKYKRQLQKMRQIITKTMSKNQMVYGFDRLNRRKQRIIKSKLSIILLQTLLKQKVQISIKLAISQINKNRLKRLGSQKIFRFMNNKYEDYVRSLLEGGKNLLNISKLLERFRRAQAIKKILEKQDQQLKKTYLNKMRKKQNKWMELAIQKFATRASIRSSPAICLWRLKAYALNS